ncbi:hypothetical protein BRD56_01335 [Thermoplasmatales archaeon SW_10_69_26]|nr:MAG: hypothetical protein BRD56_01335 [Thermoplasmatales archaeon SW_10_69_26]
MIDVKLRTTLLAVAALGLFATAFTATASASEATCEPQNVHDDTDDCREAIEDEVNETCTDATPMFIACAIETDPCQLVTTIPCNPVCTCPVIDSEASSTPIEK